MNLFQDVRRNYGNDAVKNIRDLENVDKKIARHRNHLTFTHRCKQYGVTPTSLRIRCPIRTIKAKNIIEKAQKDLARERIRVISNQIKEYEKEKAVLVKDLETLTKNDTEVRRHVEKHCESKRKAEHEKTKKRHIDKFERLKNKDQSKNVSDGASEEPDLTGTQLKRWVINTTDRKLTKPQTTLLAKGLNFAVSVDKIPNEEFIVACEKACWAIPNDEAINLRAEIAGVLKSAKIPPSNISYDERKALKELQKEKSLIIMGADKGRSTVVTSKDSYEEKVNSLLSDERTYEKLKHTAVTVHPTSTYKRKLVAILQRLKEESKIDDSQYKLLYPTAEVVPRLYCTTKIHKVGNPVRPIVDYTGSIAYQTSKALAEILAPMVGKTEHHVVNSRQLAEDLAGVIIEEGDIFNSHDVVSLFTNTPITKTLSIIKNRLSDDKTLKNRTNLSIDDIMELLEFVLTTTYFSFRGNIFKQKFGAAMGSPCSAIIANIFMEWLETEAIATAPMECKPKMWRRYVDDVLEVIKKGTTQQLTDHLNTVDPTNNIKFTHEEEENNQIPFLDTLIIRKTDGSVKLLIYRKKTHTDQYLNFSSQHPLHQKLGVVRTLLDRMECIVTEDVDKLEEESKIRSALTQCGYPKWSIDKTKQQMQNKQSKAKSKKDSTEQSKGMVVIPYVQGVSERLQRSFKKYGINTAMKPHNTLKRLLVHPKDKIDTLQTCDCVYEIPCLTCNKTYIGETGRKFQTRLNEHRKDVEKVKDIKYTRSKRQESVSEQHKSAITDHVAQENHVINWEGASIIDKDTNKQTRWIREALWIRKRAPRPSTVTRASTL
ncbi:uncharacterized protein [Amphiura filiformis]|uniref:uncharacterized protein n=1 Tax=Amphiura filiformis TaxID=82378 RepID=UPI003B20EC77